MGSMTYQFKAVLSSAAHEWMLMLLLYVNALFSYLITKFARLCKLPTPCLLCSRLDHILGDEKPGFYVNLICDAHKSEISSLAYCHVHRRLADVHEMCECCLLSFATEKKSNPETYRLLVGKLGLYLGNSKNTHPKLPDTNDGDLLHNWLHGEDAAEIPLPKKKDPASPSTAERHCSCCSEPLSCKLLAVEFLQNKVPTDDAGEIDISLVNPTGQSNLHQDGVDKTIGKSLGQKEIYHSGNCDIDKLSYVGYSEVKAISDSESEVQFKDGEYEKMVVHRVSLKMDLVDLFLHPESAAPIPDILTKSLSDEISLEKLIQPEPSVLEPIISIPEKQLHVGESYDISSLASTVAIEHRLEESEWNKIGVRIDPPATSESACQQVPSDTANMNLGILENVGATYLSTTSSMELPKALSPTDINLKTSGTINDPGLSLPMHMDLNDAYKLAVSNKGTLASPTVAEVITGRDSSRAHEDLKLLITQMSAARGLEMPWNDMSPSPRISDASVVLQNITKRLSIERNESGLESIDGSLVSEIEGESVVDRLKRQVDLDRKSLYLLYKELEEERSASAIATNQAMAMITRLQEEKAAMQMEALQYQRMMEEQAEYDQEALQKLNELLAQREKEMQDLEAEFESCRKHCRDENFADRILEASDIAEETENSMKPRVNNEFVLTESVLLKDPLMGFEDEKAYISDCLRKLEKSLLRFSNNGVYTDMARLDFEEDGHASEPCDDVTHEENAHGSNVLEGTRCRNGLNEEAAYVTGLVPSHWKNASLGNSHMESEAASDKENSSQSREDSNANTGSDSATLAAPYTIKENHKESLLCVNSDNNNNYLSSVEKMSDLTSFGDEITHLNARLAALEADHNFLEHTINSLRNGDDGVQFIQEIACHLRELRRIGITRSGHSVA